MSEDPNDILFGSSVPSAKFHQIGDRVTGRIVKLAASQQTEFKPKGSPTPGAPLTWADGKPKMQVIVTLQTNDRDPGVEDDDGQRRLFIKGKNLTDAVRDAVRTAHAKKLELGGVFTVVLTGEEASYDGGNPAKVYQVHYERPGVDAANQALGLNPWNAGPPPAQQQYDQGGFLPATPAPVQQQLPTPVAQAPVAQPAPVGGQMDLSSLPPDARALVEKMYAQQQGDQA